MTIYTDGIRVRQGQTLEEFQAGMGEYLSAKIGQAFDDSATTSLYKQSELSGALYGAPDVTYDPLGNPVYSEFNQGPDSPQVDKQAAQQRIKEAGLDGRLTVPDGGLPDRALQILIDRKHAELQRESTIARAPNSYAWAGVPSAIATQLLDPINVASMFIPAVGEERFAATVGKPIARGLAGTINGLIGSAAVEPLTYMAHTQEQADYTLTDSLTNIAFGGLLGGGLHVGIGHVADRIRAAREANAVVDAPAAEVPRGTTEQRVDAETRARIDAMPEAKAQSEIEWLRAEKQRLENELGTDELTGLRNRRAFASDEQLPVKAMLDVDSLKWVNDNMGHDVGDAYLRAVGDAMRRAKIDQAYRLSGDEFAFQARTPQEADALRARLDEELQKVTIEATLPDGTVITKQGAGVSYGRGANRAEADAGLYRNKAERSAAGLRPAERGAEPAGVARRTASRGETPVHSAAELAAAADWQTRRAALSTSVAQLAEGRAPEVDALVRTDPTVPGERSSPQDVIAAAERSRSPAGGILTSPADAVRGAQPEPELAPREPAEAIAQADAQTDEAIAGLAEVTGAKSAAKVQSEALDAETAAIVASLPADLRRELEQFDALIDDADTYGRAVKAAAACEYRS